MIVRVAEFKFAPQYTNERTRVETGVNMIFDLMGTVDGCCIINCMDSPRGFNDVEMNVCRGETGVNIALGPRGAAYKVLTRR